MKIHHLLLLFCLLPLSALACLSREGRSIDHFQKAAREGGLGKRILVFGQIHGDEPEAGILVKKWIERLERLPSVSNHWRIVPELNPDGVLLRTRTNSVKVDLNRNFPTKDWELALKDNARRNPGPSAGSEPEVQCAIKHIEEFKPDVIVSIHTPYGLFDYDGPAQSHIKTSILPWRRLGTFPGSLGRYMWDERKVPVLTIEIKPSSFQKNLPELLRFQDLVTDLLR